MYLKWSSNPKYDKDVEIIQRFLNTARSIVQQRGDSVASWPMLKDDGYFGEQTAKAVDAFQKHEGLTAPEYGVVGDTTYRHLTDFGPSFKAAPADRSGLLGGNCVLRSAGPIIKAAPMSTKSKLAFTPDFVQWGNNATALGDYISLADLSGDVIAIWTSRIMTVHFNWTKFFTDFIYTGIGLKSPTRNQTLVWVNKGKKPTLSRGNFTSYRFTLLKKGSAMIDNVKTTLHFDKVSKGLSFASLGFEYLDLGQKAFKGEAKFVDVVNVAKDTMIAGAQFWADAMVAGANVARELPFDKAVTKIGSHVMKTKFATVITKTGLQGAAATAASGVIVVGIQCVGAFLLGCEIGKFIEDKTKWGEKTVDWMWDKFLGDWIKQYYEWKYSKIVMIKYPPDWTDEDIKKFHAGMTNIK